MKMTPAEQHIAESSERRDPAALAQRLARLEDRMAASDALFRRLDREQTAMKRRFDAFIMPQPEVSTADLDIRRHLDDQIALDWKRLTGSEIEELQREMAKPGEVRPVTRWSIMSDTAAQKAFTNDQLRRLAECGITKIVRNGFNCWEASNANGAVATWPFMLHAPEAVVCDVEQIHAPLKPKDPAKADWTRPIQGIYNRRMSDLLARAAADLERAQTYWKLSDWLNRSFGTSNVRQFVGAELDALWRSLGSPPRPDLAAKDEAKGIDPAANAESDYGCP